MSETSQNAPQEEITSLSASTNPPIPTRVKSPKEYSSGSLLSASGTFGPSLISPSTTTVHEWNNTTDHTDFLRHTAPSPSPFINTRSKQTSAMIHDRERKHQIKGSMDNIDFLRIWIQREKQERDTDEARNVCRKLQKACMLREKWVYSDKNGHFPSSLTTDADICLNINIVKNALPEKSNHVFEMKHGVFRVYKLRKKRKKIIKKIHENKKITPPIALKSRPSVNTEIPDVVDSDDSELEEKIEYEYIKHEMPLYNVHSFGEFMKDLLFLMTLIMDGPARTFSYQRLQTLQAKFKLHMLLNETNEMSESKRNPHRDFYNIRKVDNHVHHSACMTQKHLLRFIKNKLKNYGDDIVFKTSDREYTIKELFAELNLTSYDLSIDTLSMHGHRDTFHRFDRFNTKYNPIGQSSLRQVFLKVDNHNKGKFLAEITEQVMEDLVDSKYQYAEFRLSIYGKSSNEWNVLSEWICDHNLHSPNCRWMIQIPRLYSVYKAKGIIENFGEMLDHIFRVLFEVTIDPLSHPKLHLFLTLVVGFDTVDDESILENTRHESYPEPFEWDSYDNPPYIVWSYYIYANLCILNQLRESRGMNAFAYRPHSGEAGDADHVAAAFLLAQSINHGLTLKKAPVLQYLYYLKQVGLSMSPLSNNLLFLEYDKNPFNIFFQRGLNVTLSTDDPLMIHYTKDPLIEEYAIAAQVYKLSAIDMCEIARNSVLQCGFPGSLKKHWLGANWHRRGVAGNDVKQTNVPSIRLLFRDELLAEEENWILGLPPPIFPAIKLHKHSKKHKLKKQKSDNFLVSHRRKVPFKLQSPRIHSKLDGMKLSQSQGNVSSVMSIGSVYDPMGYFDRRQCEFRNRYKNVSNDMSSIGNPSHGNVRIESESDGSMMSTIQEVMKKQFVLIAVGLVVGYIVASWNYRYDKRNNENPQQRK